MTIRTVEAPAQGDAPLFVGDDLALDFINTAYGLGAGHRDVLVSDESVVDWLRAVGALPGGVTAAPKGLLTLARKLRANARLLVEAAVAGEPADPTVVNQVLEAGWRPPALAWEASTQAFRAAPRPGKPDAAGLLAPIAQALTHLLTEVDLGLVRRCEGDHCTLLFHDLTKSHRRRWCSMAGCGNRMKVAAFRARQKNA